MTQRGLTQENLLFTGRFAISWAGEIRMLARLRVLWFTFVWVGTISTGHAIEWANFPVTQKIRLEIPMGLEVVEELKSGDSQKTTTSDRREQKAVISMTELDTILGKLREGNPKQRVAPIEFRARDKVKKEGKLNGTFTIYGRSALFKNRGDLVTKIRLRARIYLEVSPDHKEVERSSTCRDFAFLELKVKNPGPSERNGVHKYRIKLHDASVLKLLHSDPHHELEFDQILNEIKQDGLSMGESEGTVTALLDAVKKVAKVDEAFLQPQFITAYTRTSYAFTEERYPVPLPPKKDRRKFPQSLKFWKKPSQDPVILFKDIDYQLTIDDHVEAFTPDFRPEDKQIEVERYFGASYSGLKVRYPENARVVEIKEPTEVAQLRLLFRSEPHRFLQTELTEKMQTVLLDGFKFNKGKAAHLSRMLALEQNRVALLSGMPELLPLSEAVWSEDASESNGNDDEDD